MDALPPTVELLIDELDRTYPLRNPKPTQDLRMIDYNAGQRSVIERLRALQEQE